MVNRIISLFLAMACVFVGVARLLTDRRQGTGTILAPYAILNPKDAVDQDMALLDRQVGDLQLDNVPFEDAVSTLADRTKANIVADWPNIEGAGIPRSTRLHLQLIHATLGQALRLVVTNLSTDNRPSPIDYSADEGIITVTTRELVSHWTITDYINIRPLAAEIVAGLTPATAADRFGRNPTNELFGPRQEMPEEEIVKLITDSVAPDSWRDAGGTVGTIFEIGGVLVIVQTPENLHAIHELLEQFHEKLLADDFPPTTQLAIANTPVMIPDNPDFPSAKSKAILCINIRPLVAELIHAIGTRPTDRQPHHEGSLLTSDDIVEDLSLLIMDTIDAVSWHEGGSIRNWGDILIIVQTPENLKAIRLMLNRLHESAAAGDITAFAAPATQPAGAE